MFHRTNLQKDRPARYRGRDALLLAATIAVLGATAGTAQATYYPSKYPSVFVQPLTCAYSPGDGHFTQTTRRIVMHFSIDGANLYPTNRVETQKIYVQTALWSSETGRWQIDPAEIHGWAVGQDNSFMQYADHVPTWYDANERQVSFDTYPNYWNVYSTAKARYWVAIKVRWDASSSGAPAGSYDWYTFSNYCDFPG